MAVGLSGWVGDKVGEVGLGCESEDWGSASITVKVEDQLCPGHSASGLNLQCLTVSPRSCALNVWEEGF